MLVLQMPHCLSLLRQRIHHRMIFDEECINFFQSQSTGLRIQEPDCLSISTETQLNFHQVRLPIGSCKKVKMMNTMYSRQWMLAMPIGPTLTAER